MNQDTCSVDGCERDDVIARGYCNKHYARWRRNGDPITPGVRYVRPKCTEECSVPGCTTVVSAKSLCKLHYSRMKRTGTTKDPRETPLEKFRRLAVLEGGCRVWKGPISQAGYGYLYASGHEVLAHVFAWELELGPVPSGMEVNHLCHNRACNNVAHLEILTHQENSAYRRGANCDSKTGVRGVSFHAKTGKWRANVYAKGVSYYVGVFDTIEEADRAARRKREQVYGRPDFNPKSFSLTS